MQLVEDIIFIIEMSGKVLRIVDFYGEKSKADYPVSVKSGGGGKVSIGNILDALADKVKEGKVNPAEQKSYKVFQTVQGNGSREGIVKLHTLLIQSKFPLSMIMPPIEVP